VEGKDNDNDRNELIITPMVPTATNAILSPALLLPLLLPLLLLPLPLLLLLPPLLLLPLYRHHYLTRDGTRGGGGGHTTIAWVDPDDISSDSSRYITPPFIEEAGARRIKVNGNRGITGDDGLMDYRRSWYPP